MERGSKTLPAQPSAPDHLCLLRGRWTERFRYAESPTEALGLPMSFVNLHTKAKW